MSDDFDWLKHEMEFHGYEEVTEDSFEVIASENDPFISYDSKTNKPIHPDE